MKRVKLLSIGILVCLIGFGQDYVPFPTSDAYWNEIEQYQGVCEPPEYCKHTYFISGDTLINSILYNKIYSTDSSWVQYVGGIREDDKKIYFYDKNCTHGVLLYNFNFQIGDSILMPIHLCGPTPTSMKVTLIDSVLLEDLTYRKRFNFLGYPSWIEGMGSEGGLLYPYFNGIACVCFVELVCFKQNNSLLYYNENNVDCFDFIVGDKDINQPDNNLLFYPNPANNNLVISSSEDLELIKIRIFTQAGQEVLNIISPDHTIDISNLKPGLYFANITTSEGNVRKKIIVK